MCTKLTAFTLNRLVGTWNCCKFGRVTVEDNLPHALQLRAMTTRIGFQVSSGVVGMLRSVHLHHQ